MSKNVKVNDKTYSGVSTVELPLASGSGKAQFKDVDEITTPSGSVTITENGTHDVTNYASAVVNVASEGGGGSVGYKKTLLATAVASTAEVSNGQLVFENVDHVEMFKILMIEANPAEITSNQQRMIVLFNNSWSIAMGVRFNGANAENEYSSSNVQMTYDSTNRTYTIKGAGSSSKLANGVTYSLYEIDIDIRDFTEFDTF